jgi:hypothetical protein
MFDWLKVKTTLKDARDEIKNTRATIAQNKLRIEELKNLPPPRGELADTIDKFIDDVGDFYPERIAASMREFIHNPMSHGTPRINNDEGTIGPIRVLTATEANSVGATTKTIERALFYILGDQIKAGVRRAILEMEYPSVVGPAMSSRIAEIDTLTQQNITLEANLKGLELEIARSVDPNS